MTTNNEPEPVIDLENENDETQEENNENIEEENKPTSRLRSIVWQHFPYVEGAKSTKCKYCGVVMACGIRRNGTSSLHSHLLNTCKTSPLYKKTDLKKQSTLSFKPTMKGSNEGGSLSTHSFSQERCRLSVAKYCLKDNRPFSVVDDEGFRDMLWEFEPRYKHVSRWTVARDCLTIYEEESKKIKAILKGQTVCLTTDTWSSIQNYNYMCLTAHWIDDNWVLQKRILNFCQIENHKGDTIGGLVYDCIQDWGIETVFTITVDNASSNDGAIRYLKRMLKGPNDILDCKFLHLRCCAHIINLVVRDGLEEQCDCVTRIKNAVTYVRSSPARFKSFEDCIARVEVRCKEKPCLDVDTRWNSTYKMLDTASKYETAFDRLYEIDQATMQATIARMCLSGDEQKRRMALSMRDKYDKYWDNLDNMNFLLYVGVVLDPRYKLGYVTFCLDTIYGKGTTKNKEILGKVKSTLDELFEHYKMKFEKTYAGNKHSGTSSEKGSSSTNTTIDLESEFEKFVDEEHDTKNEVDMYLADGREKRDEHFDILRWWKGNSLKFPVLSMLARHVLAMPISTVASESAFSTGGRAIDKYRSALNAETAQALICTQDWIRNTPTDLEYGGTMWAKDIEEMNEKMMTMGIATLSKGKKSSGDREVQQDN